MLDLRLLPDDGDARLELGRLDVGDEPPLEARDEALSSILSSCCGYLSLCNDDLLAGLMKGAKAWKNLFLRLESCPPGSGCRRRARRRTCRGSALGSRSSSGLAAPGRTRSRSARPRGRRCARPAARPAPGARSRGRGASCRSSRRRRRAERARRRPPRPATAIAVACASWLDGPTTKFANVVRRVQPLDRRRHQREPPGLGLGRGWRVVGRGGAHRERARTHRRKGRRSARDRAIEGAVDHPADLHAEVEAPREHVRDGRQEVLVDPLPHELVARPQGEDAVGQPVELDAREPLIEARGRPLARCERHGARVQASAATVLPASPSMAEGFATDADLFLTMHARFHPVALTTSSRPRGRAEPSTTWDATEGWPSLGDGPSVTPFQPGEGDPAADWTSLLLRPAEARRSCDEAHNLTLQPVGNRIQSHVARGERGDCEFDKRQSETPWPPTSSNGRPGRRSEEPEMGGAMTLAAHAHLAVERPRPAAMWRSCVAPLRTRKGAITALRRASMAFVSIRDNSMT